MTKTQKIISLLLVGQWVVSTGAILALIVLDALDMEKGMELLKSYSSVTSGFVGIVVGYIFSSSKD